MNDLVKQYDEVSDEWKKAILKGRKAGMNKAVMQIRNKTKELIKSEIPNSSKRNPKYNDKLWQGARVSKFRDSSLVGEAIAGAHIMGVRKKNSGTFRLRFFENDTAERFTKDYERENRKSSGKHKVKGHSTGKLRGKGFFKKAVDSEIKNAPRIIEEELHRAINKI